MESVQIRLTHQLLVGIDGLVRRGIYSNRNEAIRDAVRRLAFEYGALAKTGRLRANVTPRLPLRSGEELRTRKNISGKN